MVVGMDSEGRDSPRLSCWRPPPTEMTMDDEEVEVWRREKKGATRGSGAKREGGRRTRRFRVRELDVLKTKVFEELVQEREDRMGRVEKEFVECELLIVLVMGEGQGPGEA